MQVRKVMFGKGGVPYVSTHDGRTIRYPDPDIKVRGLEMGDRSYTNSLIGCPQFQMYILSFYAHIALHVTREVR